MEKVEELPSSLSIFSGLSRPAAHNWIKHEVRWIACHSELVQRLMGRARSQRAYNSWKSTLRYLSMFGSYQRSYTPPLRTSFLKLMTPGALSFTQRNWLSTPTHVSLLVCTCKADFPLQQTGAATVAPRRNAEACSRANDTWAVSQFAFSSVLVYLRSRDTSSVGAQVLFQF